MITREENTNGKEMIGIGLILILLYAVSNFSDPFLTALFNSQKPDAWVYFINRLLLWAVLLLLFLYTRYVLRQNFLPWENKKRGILFYILSILSMLAILFVGLVLLAMLLNALQFNSVSKNQMERNLIYKNNISLLIFTAFTAGVLEELLFRGYIQPRVERWTQSKLWGILITSTIFGLMHLSYGTMHQVIIPIFFSIVFSSFYSKYRNLKVVIIVHFLWDFISMLDAAYNS
jgi:membrane protease YdiL (CAAX protease family)